MSANVIVTVRPDARPDIGRSGVGVVKVSLWDVGTPERQRATVDAISKVWDSRDWPYAGLLSYTVHTGEDGRSLLHYTQWRDEEAFHEFLRSHRDDRDAEIDAAVPGIQRLGLRSYELYRSGALNEDDSRIPGCVVIVDVEFDGPDAARQRTWVDGVFDALRSDPKLHPGGISGHFHISVDGTRVLNYAEWESADAHREALAAPGTGVGSTSPQWAKVQSFPGVTGGGVNRYTPALSFRAGV
ncbi:antibiotic biosynthesis monooxygenase [Streptomyces sp. NPDC005408]|uniref:antibiotic biosynthesis monooxygenase n=1 Tax=Streptomyces sp. NPDC005408 TaxID=3155341 RepID=UPI0033A60235